MSTAVASLPPISDARAMRPGVKWAISRSTRAWKVSASKRSRLLRDQLTQHGFGLDIAIFGDQRAGVRQATPDGCGFRRGARTKASDCQRMVTEALEQRAEADMGCGKRRL